MAFILLSSRSMTRSGIKALTLRQVVWGAGLACAVVGALAFGLGLAVGRLMENDSVQAQLAAGQTNPAQERFAYERLGALSGKLLTLESSAGELIKRISALDNLERKLNSVQNGFNKNNKSVVTRNTGSAGGAELAPRCEYRIAGSSVERVAQAEKTVDCLQKLLSQVDVAASDRSVAYMSVPSRAPINSSKELGSAFGNRIDPITGRIAFHSGLDFSAETGSPILAAGGGLVKFAGWQSELGNVVEIDHGNGLMTRYAHASKLLVKTGDLVTPRQHIAAVGSTGRSTGPHLHFEVLHEGRYVDPQHYLQLGG